MPLARAVLLLAVPMVLEMVMESVFAVADIFWVSKLGADAVAAVGLTETLETVVYAASMGLAMGVGALVARRTGAKDHDGAARAAVQAILIGVGLALSSGIAGALAGPRLLALMGASPSVQAIGAGYARTMLGGSVTVVLLFLINSAFRGAGDAAITMRTLWLANGINIVLGPVLVFGLGPAPRLGVTGAAVATTIGRGIGVLYQLRALSRGTGRLVVRREHLALDLESLRTILGIAKTGIVADADRDDELGRPRPDPLHLRQRGAGRLHDRHPGRPVRPAAVVGSRQRGRDAGRPEPGRRQPGPRRAGGLAGGLLQLPVPRHGRGRVRRARPPDRPAVHARTPAVVAEGGRCLRIVAAGFAFYAYGMVVSQAFNGAGDTRTPTLINFFCFWVGEIPLAFLLSRTLGLGPTGAYLAITAGVLGPGDRVGGAVPPRAVEDGAYLRNPPRGYPSSRARKSGCRDSPKKPASPRIRPKPAKPQAT